MPLVPYNASVEKVIYPLLIFYKSFGILHILLIPSVFSISLWIAFQSRRVSSFYRLAIMCLVILNIFFAGSNLINLFKPDYQHHDTLKYGGYVYKLGSSTGDWGTLYYIVYRCDSVGIICENIPVRISGLDRSQLPFASAKDRTASFVISEDADFAILVDNVTYPIRLDIYR